MARTSEDASSVTLDREVAVIRGAHARFLTEVARFDRSRAWERDGATSMTAWLAPRYGLSRRTARETVRVARALRRLPAIAAAYAAGRLAWDQLQPLTRFASPETDELWAETAPSLRPAALVREAKRHERMRRRDAEEAYRLRSLAMWRDPELPVMYVEGALPAEQGEAVHRALIRHVEEVGRKDRMPGVPFEARMADALVELVTSGGPRRGGEATVVVHAQAEVLTGSEPGTAQVLAETEGGQRLTAEAVRRLACDGGIEWLLERGGRTVGIGRRSRTVPGAMMRALRHRDGGCRFPGCERTTWMHAHHVVHWADDGRTDLENLVLLCSTHHRLVHEGGWSIVGSSSRELRFHDSTGRTVGLPATVGEVDLRARSFP